MEETSRGCGAGGGLAETKGNQLQNFLKAEKGGTRERAAPGGRAGSCLRRWGRGRQPGPCPPLSSGHHDQRDPEEELQQAGPAEPHQVRAHLPAGGAGLRLAAARRGAHLPAGGGYPGGGGGWGEGRKFIPDRPSSCPFKSAGFLPHPYSPADAMRWNEGK